VRPEAPLGWKPTKEQLAAAYGKTIKDVIAPGLGVLFVGINPGLYSGATGDHFARPGNRFWPTLHAAGFTPRVLHPSEKNELLTYGLGITNLVARTTARADELDDEELRAGAKKLATKVRRYSPQYVAFLGLTAYRIGTGHKKASVGPQEEVFGGASAWLLPNTSGLNAHYQLPDLARIFGDLRRAAKTSPHR
jgi:TDG/mug DNA glycosylase family protein